MQRGKIPTIRFLAMTHIEDIRNFLNAAMARLAELEAIIEQRTNSVHGWDASVITQACADQWTLQSGTLHSPSQERPIAHARQAAMFLMAKHTPKSRREIAKFFRPDMDVSTVNYAIRNVPVLMQADANFAGKVVRAETAYIIAKQNKQQ